MKRIIMCLLTLVVVLNGCGAGSVNEEAEAVINNYGDLKADEEKQSKEDTDVELSELDELPNTIEAKEYIFSLEFVESYTDNKYAVYGTNINKDKFCGILYSNGRLKIFEDYTKVYPLKEGRLLATTEEEPPNMSFASEKLQNATVSGEIIDEDGSVVFSEPNAYFRFVPVNKDRIIVFQANSGFEGATLEYGVIDSDGNWIKDLSAGSDLEKILLLADQVKINADGTWAFKANKKLATTFIYRQENALLFLVQDEGYGSHIFSLCYLIDQNEFVPFNYGGGYISFSHMLSNNNIILWTGSVSVGGTLSHNSYDIYEMDGKIIDSVKGKRFLKGNNTANDYLISREGTQITNLVTGTVIELPDSMSERIGISYLDDTTGLFYIRLTGADKNIYISVIDMMGNVLKEPTLFRSFGSDMLFYDDVVVVGSESNKKIYIADIETLDILYEIDIDFDQDTLFKLSNDAFAVQRNTSTGEWSIYNLQGEMLY